jgi:hypothetical protein
MDIKIKKINTQVLTGNASGIINTFRVIENDKEVLLTRTSRIHGSSIGIAGKEGVLYVDSDDNRVHRQVVALSGACGLNTDDEVIEGLSSRALKGVILADRLNESEEITIIIKESGEGPDKLLVFVDGKSVDSIEF